nr:MAG TPA: hypothetical protein [Caudoviricetes sp.]
MRKEDLETMLTGLILDAMEDTRPIDREYIAKQYAILGAAEITRRHRPTYVVKAP